MQKKIKQLAVALVMAFSLSAGVGVLAPVTAGAASAVTSGLCEGITAAESETGEGAAGEGCLADAEGQNSANRLIRNVINLFSLIVGVVAVIMIVYGGFKYITSGGNDSNVSAAKNTILYAVIGLVIVALAQVIVRFVLSKATQD